MRRETEIGTTRTGVDGGDPNVPLWIEAGQLPALAAVPRGLDVVCAANSREAGNILESREFRRKDFALRALGGGFIAVVFGVQHGCSGKD